MLSLGLSMEELLAKNVCGDLTKVMANDKDDGEKIAIRAADGILEEVDRQFKNKSLISAIKSELLGCYPNLDWTFKNNNH